MIPPKYVARGHKYVMGNVNAYCPKCSGEYTEKLGRPIVALDCDWDEEDDDDACNDCGRPCHYDEESGTYQHDEEDAPDCFLIHRHHTREQK